MSTSDLKVPPRQGVIDVENRPVVRDHRRADERAADQGREYTLAILKATPVTFQDASRPVIWEHGRRNMALHDAGVLPIVCPVTDGSDVAGIGIFAAPSEEVRQIVDRDPAVEAGILTYELHPVRGFPGDALP